MRYTSLNVFQPNRNQINDFKPNQELVVLRTSIQQSKFHSMCLFSLMFIVVGVFRFISCTYFFIYACYFWRLFGIFYLLFASYKE